MAPSRIEELRRRVQADPASIAFAQLAEEYRRSGQTDEAVRVCREGLTRHPGYLSARVTLGRALLDLSQLDAARSEFEFVVAEAPENLAAVRGLAEISQRDGQLADALNYYRRALALARHDPEIEEIVQQLSRQVGVAASTAPGGLSFEEAHQELLSAAERVPVVAPRPAPASVAATGPTAPFDFEKLVAALGSPAPPPQLEAAVAGHSAAVSIPDGIDLGPNPFAALEAELRAHDAASATAAESIDAGRYEASAARAAHAVDVPAPVASADAVLEDTMLAVPADTWTASLDTASLADDAPTVVLPPMSAGDGEAVEGDAPAEAGPVELEGASPEATDTMALASAETAVVETVAADAVPAPVSDTAIEPTALAPAAEAFADVPVETPVDPPVAVTEPATDAPAPLAFAAPAAPPTAPSEDVLDDLESWLNTLHDRTGS